MICRAIKKRNGDIYICPAQLESATENPLTAEQQLIVELDDRVTELEQDLKDNELRRKDLLTSLQRSNAQKAELEAEKAELVEALRLIKHKLETDPAITDTIWIDDNPMCSETAVDRINNLLGIDE